MYPVVGMGPIENTEMRGRKHSEYKVNNATFIYVFSAAIYLA